MEPIFIVVRAWLLVLVCRGCCSLVDNSRLIDNVSKYLFIDKR